MSLIGSPHGPRFSDRHGISGMFPRKFLPRVFKNSKKQMLE
jgi:hypothetical protein